MMDAFVGTLVPVAFNFNPPNWMKCEGQLLPISQFSALFSLIGTTYGGDGRTNFALPDLRGRVAVGAGQGPGTSPVQQGQVWGSENAAVTVNGSAAVTIDAAHLPKHNHPVAITSDQLKATSTLYATSSGPGSTSPGEGTALGNTGSGPQSAAIYTGNGAVPGTALNSGSVATKLADVNVSTGENGGGAGTFPAPVTAQGQASVVQPSLGITWLICINGIYPSRD
jgi:microcystin-dependent protein